MNAVANAMMAPNTLEGLLERGCLPKAVLLKKNVNLLLLYGRRRVGKTRLVQEFKKMERGLFLFLRLWLPLFLNVGI
jgi:hypothetical protein